MTPFLQLALALALIITAAKISGYLSVRMGQPAVLGELFVGILLGPSVLDVLHQATFTDTHLTEIIHELAEVGVLLLMFLAGLELHLADLLRAGRVSALAGVMGVILPLGFGAAAGLLFGMTLPAAIFVGLILSATSVSISAQTLMELKVLRSRVGVGMLGAAVIDDILVLLGLAVFTALTQSEGVGFASVLWIIVKMALFLGLATALGWWAFPRINHLISGLPISQGLIAFAFVMILLYGLLAETLGSMAAITGAFVAGLCFSHTAERERIHHGMATIAYSIFVPIFFINIGLSANARQLTWQSGLLMLVMVIVAVAGKVLGAGTGAAWAGLTRREALQLGIGMISRGEVGLIVAAIGIQQGLIQSDVFAAIVGVVIITTILTPILLRGQFPKHPTVAAKEPKPSEGV